MIWKQIAVSIWFSSNCSCLISNPWRARCFLFWIFQLWGWVTFFSHFNHPCKYLCGRRLYFWLLSILVNNHLFCYLPRGGWGQWVDIDVNLSSFYFSISLLENFAFFDSPLICYCIILNFLMLSKSRSSHHGYKNYGLRSSLSFEAKAMVI